MCHANDNENRLGGLLHRRSCAWDTRARPCSVLLPAASGLCHAASGLRLSDKQRLPTRLHGAGWELRAVQRSRRGRMEYVEWVSTRLHSAGWKLRTLQRSRWSELRLLRPMIGFNARQSKVMTARPLRCRGRSKEQCFMRSSDAWSEMAAALAQKATCIPLSQRRRECPHRPL